MTLALAAVGLICCVVGIALLVFASGPERSRPRRDALGGMVIGVALMGIAFLLRG